MKIRGFARDELGRLVPPGMTEITYESNFLRGEALPSWLTATGTVTPAAWGTGTPGGITVATDGTVDANAMVSTPTIPQDQFAAIAFEVKGLKFAGMFSSLLTFGIHSTSTPYGGAHLVQRETEDWCSFNIPGQGTTEYGRCGYTLRTLGESAKYRNLGFMLNCRTRTAWVYEDDPAYPIATLDVGTNTVQGGPVLARLRVQAKNATVQSMRLAGVRLRLWPEPHVG